MKTAEQIAQEIKKHKPIDKTNVMYDETWEDYMRGRKMTRAEAIEILKSKMDGRTDTSYEWAETVRMAIKALENENVIDKIRAKIETWHKDGTNWSDIRLMDIEDIINKYKSESK